MNAKTYVYHTDPGHGWLAVKRNELLALGILNEVSDYSYQQGQTVYLEEDWDAPLFIRAYMARYGIAPVMRDSYQKSSPIRGYGNIVR